MAKVQHYLNEMDDHRAATMLQGLLKDPAPTEGHLVGKFAASVETTATPASGSCGVQFVFKDNFGQTMDVPVAGLCYLSEVSTGLTHDLADTSFAVLTNGVLQNIVAKGLSLFITTAAGLLGATITAAADDYYVVFILPSGRLLISGKCTVNA